MKPLVYIFINGIMNNPGCSDNWTDRAVTWMHTNTLPNVIPSEKFEYFTGPLLRRVFQQYRANKLTRMLSFYFAKGYEVVLVGHSNGCDIICRVLAEVEHPVKEVHLIAAACDEPVYEPGMVGDLFVYIGGQDKAMKLARFSKKLLGKLHLGYGSLGGMDPKLARDKFGEEHVVYHPSFGHSTWFEKGPIFDMTMMTILGKRGDDL